MLQCSDGAFVHSERLPKVALSSVEHLRGVEVVFVQQPGDLVHDAVAADVVWVELHALRPAVVIFDVHGEHVGAVDHL